MGLDVESQIRVHAATFPFIQDKVYSTAENGDKTSSTKYIREHAWYYSQTSLYIYEEIVSLNFCNYPPPPPPLFRSLFARVFHRIVLLYLQINQFQF